MCVFVCAQDLNVTYSLDFGHLLFRDVRKTKWMTQEKAIFLGLGFTVYIMLYK